MPVDTPAWVIALGSILALVIHALVKVLFQERERLKDEARNIETAPDDTSGKRDAILKRLHDGQSAETPPKS